MLAVIQGTSGAALVAALYLLVGAGVSLALARRGRDAATAAGAVVAWPLLLPLLGSGRREAGSGPMARRIDEAFDALLDTLADPAAADVPFEEDVDELREALSRVDQRLALVDRLLQQEGGSTSEPVARSVETLRRARARAAGEIEAVLAEVAQLRIQVGLMALAGETVSITDKLRELRARAAAIEEVAEI
jgi:hypothetical protein